MWTQISTLYFNLCTPAAWGDDVSRWQASGFSLGALPYALCSQTSMPSSQGPGLPD